MMKFDFEDELFDPQKNSGRKRTALTIAGSDSSGGAGIQADIKTMSAFGVFAMSAITALTAQNTCEVSAVMNVPADFLAKQIDTVFSDITPDAVKIGMIASPETAEVIADRLNYWKPAHIVTDPVAVATSGSKLSTNEAYEAVKKLLFPMSDIITPNVPEAELISGICINNADDMRNAAEKISQEYGCCVLCKGGHMINDANDVLYSADGSVRWFRSRHIDNPNTHGTGCTLSSAIAACLAKGMPLADAVMNAKEYISGALEAMLDLGKGSGPLDHMFDIHSHFSI